MGSIVEILLTGWIDPLIWIKCMATLGLKRSRKQCIAAFFLCYALVIGKAYTAERVNMGIISTLLTIMLAGYLFGATVFLFQGKARKKIVYVCMLCGITFSIEFIIVGIGLLVRPDALEIMMNNRVVNLISTGIAKGLQSVSCYWIFGRRKVPFFSQSKEIASLLIVSFFLLVDIIMKCISNGEHTNAMLLFWIMEVFFLWYMVRALQAVKSKEKKLHRLNQIARQNVGQAELSRNIDHFRHEFHTYAFLIKNLWYCGDYDKLEEYMGQVFKEIPKVALHYDHPNFAVRIIVSAMLQMADEAGIVLDVQIDIAEFGMHDEQICTMLWELVLDGMKHATEASIQQPEVSLHIISGDKGYEIQCVSDCVRASGEGEFQLDDVMYRVTKRYSGTVTRSYIEGQRERVRVSIWIPLEGGGCHEVRNRDNPDGAD